MKSLFITQEYAPLFAEGGLGLASSALPAALQRRHGIEHDLVLPYYPWLVERHGLRTEEVCRIPEIEVADRRASATILRLRDHDAPCTIHLVRCDAWYDRGAIYCDDDYHPFADEAERAAFFGHCVAEWVERDGRTYDLVHANDWQSGAALAGLRARDPELPTLLTVHNGMYQGRLKEHSLDRLALSDDSVRILAAAGGDDPSMLLLGLLHADTVATCSPGYAREMATAFAGTPVGAALASARTRGIVFGVDADVWDSAAAGRLTVPFGPHSAEDGKRRNKAALQRRTGLRVDGDVPVLGVCSRLVPEKGTDLLLEGLAPLLREGEVQLALAGPAAVELRPLLRRVVEESAGSVAYLPEFDQDWAWLIYAGSDFTVMPSRTEPCGLNQLISYRYGTLPLVSPVGGLSDTVTDLRTDPGRGSGMFIPELTPESVRGTVLDAMRWRAGQPGELAAARQRVMRQDWSWGNTADGFAQLYRETAARRGRLVSSAAE
ncbi:glycogen/starch synthase [Streptomyces sp. MB09-01]|uniref:glycogen synthase n=1 Tax=Streptomyces sp. MB09-01 TaxID=3028666 RepID=UPI0029B3E875|nr:glycogen/starch synthase [Streptomyces sp. MB09-01]MDX3535542.1 glycogen/starch synthase [Streptomyces sp. MB09-01]